MDYRLDVSNSIRRIKDYRAELSDDPVVHSHLGTLYDNLLEQNLSRLLEPFSNVQIEHIARLIDLPQVEIDFVFVVISLKCVRSIGFGGKKIISNDFRQKITWYSRSRFVQYCDFR